MEAKPRALRPPGRLFERATKADEGVGRGPGGPTHNEGLIMPIRVALDHKTDYQYDRLVPERVKHLSIEVGLVAARRIGPS